MTAPATERYVAADFNNAPLLALADLMGLGPYKEQIGASPEIYRPILNGIAVFRHLEPADRVAVNRLIVENVPRGILFQKLRMLISDLSVQHFWHLWSLSDEELLEFFHYSKGKLEFTEQFNPLSLPEFTVGSVAGAVYAYSRGRPRAMAQDTIDILKDTNLVQEVAKRMGFGKKLAKGLGIASIPTFIVISGLNIMAKGEHDKARRELAARGLLVYSDL
ncbi:MAG: hypothetical protein HLX50_21635 [Alteromonadaceae bacterium]|nr:hypothetical protein [Alteromonadaceae bacterium]